MQTLATAWTVGAIIQSAELIDLANLASVSQRVVNRPDRIEPRENKRRPKLIALLNKPRQLATKELFDAAT